MSPNTRSPGEKAPSTRAPGTGATGQVRDRIGEVLTEPLAAIGLDVEAVEITPAGKRRLLRVAVDKDGGVSLDDIAEATKEVSRLLDESDAMGEGAYTLEVSSPGIDRPLTLPRHWRRNAGRLVKITTVASETVSGRITSTDDIAAVLDVKGKQRRIAFVDVEKAKVQVEFNRKGPEPADAGTPAGPSPVTDADMDTEGEDD